jgi:hypothetical protein
MGCGHVKPLKRLMYSLLLNPMVETMGYISGLSIRRGVSMYSFAGKICWRGCTRCYASCSCMGKHLMIFLIYGSCKHAAAYVKTRKINFFKKIAKKA